MARRLEDVLATKDGHERKAFALLTAYITIAVGTLSVFGALARGADPGFAPAFLVIGSLFALGAVVAAVALWPLTYGALGSDPSGWLRPGVIDGDASALAASLAYETFFCHERIVVSQRSNERKVKLIRAALVCGVAAPCVLCTWIWLAS